GVNIRHNITFANTVVSAGYDAAGLLGALAGYYLVVHTTGPQDVKNQPGPGTKKQRRDAGNISFGVTCPFGARFCQFAAGFAQSLSGHPAFTGPLATGFDTPSDN